MRSPLNEKPVKPIKAVKLEMPLNRVLKKSV